MIFYPQITGKKKNKNVSEHCTKREVAAPQVAPLKFLKENIIRWIPLLFLAKMMALWALLFFFNFFLRHDVHLLAELNYENLAKANVQLVIELLLLRVLAIWCWLRDMDKVVPIRRVERNEDVL